MSRLCEFLKSCFVMYPLEFWTTKYTSYDELVVETLKRKKGTTLDDMRIGAVYPLKVLLADGVTLEDIVSRCETTLEGVTYEVPLCTAGDPDGYTLDLYVRFKIEGYRDCQSLKRALEAAKSRVDFSKRTKIELKGFWLR